MNRIDWLIATGGNPCFGLEALIPILAPVIGETAAGIAGPALVGGAETAAGGALLGGITGGGQGAARGAEVGGLTGAGIFGGGPAAAAAGLPATLGTTVGGLAGGALGGAAAGENPLLTGAVGGVGGLGAGLSGIGATPAAPAAAAAAPTSAPMAGAGAVNIPTTGIQSYSDQLGVQGGLPGPQGINPTVQTDVQSLAPPGSNPPLDNTQPALAGPTSGTLSPPPDAGGGGGGATGGAQPLGGGGGGGGQPGDPGVSTPSPSGQANDPASFGGQTWGGNQDWSGAKTGGSGIMDFLGNPSPLQLAGAGVSGLGLLMSGLRGNQYAGLENQLQQQATGAAGMTTALQSPLFTGILPPGAQQNLDQQKADAAAAIRGSYARAGMAGSTSEAQQIAAENARIDNSKLQIEQQMFNDAAGYARLAPAELQQLYNIQNQQDQNYQNALARFVAALAGGRGGTSQSTAA